ncbi:MAG TPA: HAMP domain-containing sensor histidine kinase [Acidobacteriota bacterium]
MIRNARHKRQLLLFITAILLPAAVLIALAVQVLRQDTELSEKRALDDRQAARDQLRRELAARLEAVKLQEMNLRIQSPSVPTRRWAAISPIVLVAALEQDHMVFPWVSRIRGCGIPSPLFAQHRQKGEAEEFISKNSAAAVAAYRAALAAAHCPSEICEARLLLARNLIKMGMTDEGVAGYRVILNQCGAEFDEEGVPVRLYAAERLMQAGRESAAVQAALMEEGSRLRWRSPAEAYMLNSLLHSLPGELAAQARRNLEINIHEMEQIGALARDLSLVRARMQAGAAQGRDSVWVAYGNEPWLVTVTPPAPPISALVFVISSRKVAPPGTRLVAHAADATDSLGESFPGLNVEWKAGRFAAAKTTGRLAALYLAGLALILGITLFGGYLLLRDVNRDMRMAEMRSQFVASVSHELKTPITAIRMFAETLALGRGNEEQIRAEYLETIVQESERLARLVDNVLDFSKIEQGKKIYRMRPTSLQDVIRSAARAMQYPLAQQGFTLQVSIDDEVPALQADSDAMQQAVLNLLTNAMKYSGEAREIELRLGAVNGDAVIEVSDRGLGIAREDQARIFEKFYRIPSPQNALIAGTGLGLTLVAHIAAAHGGRVGVQSAPGQGSTFSIQIPVRSEGRA